MNLEGMPFEVSGSTELPANRLECKQNKHKENTLLIMFAKLVLGLCLLYQGYGQVSAQVQQSYTEPSRFPAFPTFTSETDQNSSYTQLGQNSGNSTQIGQNDTSENASQSYGLPYQGETNGTRNSTNGKPVYIPDTQYEIGGQLVARPINITALIGAEKFTKKSPPLSWHVGIYNKYFNSYMQICGGSLVTTKAVISAAHCFWNDDEGALPASRFAVGAGKLYRPWNDSQDTLSQRSDVSAIHIPPRYRGTATHFQDDIAVVILTNELIVTSVVRPACVDFDDDFDRQQLRKGNLGTVMGWGLTEENGLPSQVLNFLELPAVDIEECIATSEPAFIKYITSDKICAGVTTGKALCRGDSGGGLVFFDRLSGGRIPYLRGIASTAPRNENLCNAYAIAALTHTNAHRAFLRQRIPGLERECEKHYPLAKGIDDRSGNLESVGEQNCAPVRFVCNCYCNNTRTCT